MKIVGIDLGKFKSVVCELNTDETKPQYDTISTTPSVICALLEKRRPDRVVIEIGSQAGWVCDTAESLQLPCQVANTNHETWQWRKTRSKTDRQDALCLAKLSLLEELPTVHMPSAKVRQKRSFIAYRQKLVQRQTRIKNGIRALLDRQGLRLPAGKSGWTRAMCQELREIAQRSGRSGRNGFVALSIVD